MSGTATVVARPHPPDEPINLVVGPWTATIQDGAIHHLRFADGLLLRSIYVAVRDQSWNTVAGRVGPVEVQQGSDAVKVVFDVEHASEEVGFSWRGVIDLDADGTGRFTMDGIVTRGFLRNRIGLCVLHPLVEAGRAIEVIGPISSRVTRLPSIMAPIPPITDIVGLRWRRRDGVSADLRFDGDLFELEDQRNWTDASFKTFSTPLYLERPVAVDAGTQIHQAVTFGARAEGPVRAKRRPTPAIVTRHVVGRLPPIGTVWGRRPLTSVGRNLLQALNLEHLRAEIDTAAPDRIDAVHSAARAAAGIGAELDLAVIDGTQGAALESFFAEVVDVLSPRSRVFVVGGRDDAYTTGAAVLAAARQAAARLGMSCRIGGGTLRNAYDLASGSVPYRSLDVVTYHVDPQVHVTDDASILESTAGQRATLRAARLRCGPVPLVVGPITLRPVSTSASFPTAFPGIPPWADPRQATELGALFTLGSIASFARPGVEAITLFEASGMAGLIPDPAAEPFPSAFGVVPTEYPLTAVLRKLPPAGASVLATSAPDGVLVIAFEEHPAPLVLVGNADTSERSTSIVLPTDAGVSTWTVVGWAVAGRSPRPRTLDVVLGPRAIVAIAASTPQARGPGGRVPLRL